MKPAVLLVLWLPMLGLHGCKGGTTITESSAVSSASWAWSLPPNFPTPAVPSDNPMTEDKFQLGRRLFYDKRLSGNGTLACAGCHRQELAFTDGAEVSTGSTGDHTPRNAPSIANSAFHTTFTWINPTLHSLEKQMETPLYGASPVEMGVTPANEPVILARLKADSEYPALFRRIFPADPDPFTFANIIKAISAFERGVLTGNSRYERYERGQAALSAGEERGRQLFNSEKAECFHCHGSFNFNDQVTFAGDRNTEALFHNTGLYNIGGAGAFPDNNRGLIAFTGVAADMGAFRAASLYNVGVTAPYMHDGSIATLEQVLDFYAAGGRVISSGPYAGDGRLNPYKSDLIVNINLTAQDKADLVAFLKTLTDEDLLTNARYSDPFK